MVIPILQPKTPIFINAAVRSISDTVSALVWLLLATIPTLTIYAQHPGQLFGDNFESAASVSPYTIAQQQATNSLARDCDPGPAQVGGWFTYGGEADGGPGLFAVQVTSNVDAPPYTGTYQGSNVLRIFRSPNGSSAAAAANFATTQQGGKVRATWIEMVHPASAYNCMIHFSGTQSPGGEGFDTARLSLVIHSDGSCVYYSGGWVAINGLTATMNKWQTHQLDVDLDNQKWTWTIDGVSSGEISGFGNAPGNTAASMTFRGGAGANDLFYIDSLEVYPLAKPILAEHTPADGQHVETNTPVQYTLTDGITETNQLALNTNTIQLLINGSRVTPDLLTKTGSTTTVRYLAPGGWRPESTNTVRLIYATTNSPPAYSTNDFSFVVLPTVAFTLGWYHDAQGGNGPFDEMAAHGFNTIMDYEITTLAENGNGQLVQDQLIGASARGIRLQFELSNALLNSTTNDNWSRLDALLNQYKNYPLASWQMSDEPYCCIPVDVFTAAASHIRQVDTNHPLSAVFGSGSSYQPYLEELQIAAVDNYPYTKSTLSPNLRNYTKSAKQLVQLSSGKHTLFVVQGFDPTVDGEFANFVQPTAEQQRFLTFAPLTVGIDGLMYWTFYRNSPASRASKIYPVTDRLVGLVPVLTSTNAAPQVSSDGDNSSLADGLADVTYLKRQYQGSTYIIAANNLGATRSVTFTVPGQWPAATIVNVLTENRTVLTKVILADRLVFTDTFDAYKIHLYEVIPAPSLVQVGYWRFEEASGPVAFDSARSPTEDGILGGGAERSPMAPTAIVPRTGAANTRSMQFGGADGDAVDMDGSSGLDVGSGDFTLEAWINARTIPGGTAFIAGKRLTGLFGGKGYELLATSSGSGFTVGTTISGGGATLTATSGVLNFDHWYHLAAVRAAAGTNLSLYIDGVLVQSVVDSLAGTDLTSSQHFSVGGAIEDDGSFHRPFDGFIDEVRLTKAALPPAQFLNGIGLVLSITRSGNQVTLAWAGAGFVLQENNNLANPNVWTDVTNGMTSPVTVPIQGGNKFYRLSGR